MSTNSVDTVIESLRNQCQSIGLDLVQPFLVQAYNQGRPEDSHIPEFGRKHTLGALVGNTRAFWSYFLRHLAQHPELLELEHPLDTYVTQQLNSVVETIPLTTEIRFSYEKEPRFVSLQAVCELAGLAPLRAGMLNVHPVYGPWIALRAILCFDLNAEGLEVATQPTVPSDWEEACQVAFQEACADAGDTLSHQDIKANWKRWLKVRDACPIGREHRYSEAQILYHYTQDRELLRQAVDALQ